MTPPPVDLSILGQMTALGDFDAITPVTTPGQQNTFESSTFSILELSKIATESAASNSDDQKILSVPVLLASFGIEADESGRAPAYGISATCVLDSAAHEIYIGGYFRQIPSSLKFADNHSNGTAVPDKASTTSTSNSVRTGLNYIGLYDSKLKRFLAMENGLDGPVESLMCDSSTDQVFVVGDFRAPLQDDTLSDGDRKGDGSSSQYQTLGSFGGGVAVWKRAPGRESGVSGSIGKSSYNSQIHPPTQASGSWVPLPFKGVNKIVNAVAKTQDGTYYFGGQFDTTTDGEEFSAPDTQLVNLASAEVNTGNGLDVAQDRSIICQNASSPRTNWIMRDNIPGYWRVKFPLLITPTLFRLWNVDETQGAESANRGTKTFSIMAQPSNQYLNLSYIDPVSHGLRYCTVCPLLPRPSLPTELLHSQREYQDFLVVKPELLHAAQIDVVSWYGLGGGLGGVEVYQSEIFVRAVDRLNFAAKCATSTAGAITEDLHENRDLTAYSSFMGADWVEMRMPDGWQTVLAASVSSSDDAARKQAYVDMAPYLQEPGMYDVFLYTPACGSSKSESSPLSVPSNACANRGSIDVSMYFGSPQNVVTVTLQQTNTADKYEKIYSGMIVRSTADFRPHVVVKPSSTKAGASGGGKTQTVIVDSIQFVKQATLNNTNSLLFYRPGSGQSVAGGEKGKSGKNVVEGIDSSTWGNLATQLPGGSLVNALVAYSGSLSTSASSASSSILVIAGDFQSSGYSNIVAWDGGKFVQLGQPSGSSSGLDGPIADMVLEQSTLYMAGNFQQAYGSAGGKEVALFGGLASYNIPTMTWSSFGNVSQNFQPGARFKSIELSAGADGQPQLLVGGAFTWIDGTSSVSMAIWDIGAQTWIREDPEASRNDVTSSSNGFSFGFMRGQISYLSRVLASSSDGSTAHKTPVVLVAGMIHSVDTYQVQQPENMAWLTDSGKLRTWNLSPALSASSMNANMTPPEMGPTSIDRSAIPEKTNAGLIYMNPGSQEWVTVVGGALAGGMIGIGFLRPSQENTDAMIYKNLNVAAATSSPINGEVLALGIDKDEINGHNSLNSGSDLLLIGGAFKSPGGSGSSEVNGVALFDLTADLVVPATLMPVMRGVTGIGGRDPVVRVIKSRPGSKQATLVLAGDFSGVGTGVTCELICLWDPAEARKALDKKKSLESSFKSVYGDNGSNKKHIGILRGVVNDIAFEDVLGLISGGKDSFYNLMQCAANGHSIIALGNLHPNIQDKKDELDSYMYQTVGHDVIHLYRDCLELPLYRQEIKGTPIEQGSDYVQTKQDETEDLYELLAMAKAAHPDLEAVSVGAILSNYQRIRVESVCGRLGLVTLAYLWQRDQEELLHEMAQAGVNAVLIKIAAIGLKKQHLGRSIGDMFPHLCKMNQEYDLHICGEGGEYETITLDCPLFKRRIVVDESEVVIHSDDAFAQVAYLRFKKLHLEDKSEDETDPSWMADMNLDPVWEADAVMMPVEDIVRSKQLLLESKPLESLETPGQRPQRAPSSQDLDARPCQISKFTTHQSDIVCAIGGTTAHEIFSLAGSKKHMSIAEETTVCLKTVASKLERIGLSWTEVVFMQVFVSDMADFGVVNGAYKAFFGINPPPRACVGANLPRPCRIQVSCTAIRSGASIPKPRQTLHVQGISYWAPANIGPYSQATEASLTNQSMLLGQAYHAFIAGQIGMIPSTLDLPEPPSLAKETAWSLRNLTQIANNREYDLVNRTALCVVYVRDPKDFGPVTAAWDCISTKKSPAPLLAVCVPSLPKGGQVEWQAMLHQGKVYADKAPIGKEDEDGYETDDDDMYQLEKRALHPTTLQLEHEPTGAPGVPWKARTQSWYLSPLLTALSVICLPAALSPSLSNLLSVLSVSSEAPLVEAIPEGMLKDMMAMLIKAVDRVLEAHRTPVAGPGVEGGWRDVVNMTLFYHDTLVVQPESLAAVFEQILSQSTQATSDGERSSCGGVSNIALTLVPVQAIAGGGLVALTVHAVGRQPTVPGLLQA
ncbi:ATP binding domain 4 [Mortierella alpina]|nr:ATP binding domain 4 [Mortierella alpina]